MNSFRNIFYPIFLLILVSQPSAVVSGRTINSASTDKFVNIGGIKIRYVQFGKGADILLIHGKPGCLEDWSPLFDMEDQYRITTFDRVGQCLSQSENRLNNIPGNSKITSSLIEKLGLSDITVIGHSYGGAIALHLAIKKHPKIRDYLLISSHSYPPEWIHPSTYLLVCPVVGNWFAKITNHLVEPIVEMEIRRAFAPNLRMLPEGFIDFRIPLWSTPKVLLSLAREEQNIQEDLDQIVKNLSVISKRVVIIHGTDDLLIPIKRSILLDKTLENSKLVSVNDAGHFLQFSHLDVVINELNELRTHKNHF